MTIESTALTPITGILDIDDDRGYVRVHGYLSTPDDVHVSTSQLTRYGLRRGDLVTGAVRTGEPRRGRHAPVARLDTVNGMEPEEARRRPEFYKLTPLYPQERLRLETEPHILARASAR